MRIALLGYGKMGHSIEQEALQRNHAISFKITSENKQEIELISKDNTDIVIEFTRPETALQNFRTILSKGVPLVSGTTGWTEQLAEVEQWVSEQNGSFLYSSNFSIGVNILFKLNETLARFMNQYPGYDAFVEEKHHKHKKDAPSGTALSLGNQVVEGLDRKSKLVHTDLQHRSPEDDELSISWTRSGEIIGQHTVGYTSEIDEISIHHRAYNRRGFALGSVIAAEWLFNKRGFYNFAELFK